MKPQLEELQNVVQDSRDQAQEAQESAERAADETDSVKQVIFSSWPGNDSLKFTKKMTSTVFGGFVFTTCATSLYASY